MEKKIIEFVRANKCIYDKNHESFRNQILKDKKWMELSKEMNVSVESLKKRWKSMRDRFYRVRKNSANSGLESPDQKKYKHYDSLLFLLESSKKRAMAKFEASEEEFEESLFADVGDCSSFSFNEILAPSLPTSTGKNKQSDPIREELLSILKSVKTSTEQNVTPFRTFLESIALTVEEAKCDLSQITRIQIGILQLVKEEINNSTYS